MANELENANQELNQNNEPSKEDVKNTAELEARIKALETENGKLRQANTNASADASKWKKQYQDKLSEEEKAKIQQDEQTAAMQKELEDLRNERNIARYTGTLVASDIGMDADTAKAVAEALNAGETDKVFDGIRKFIATHDKMMRENALKSNQTLQGGSLTKTVSQQDFNNMSYMEMLNFKRDNPEQYAEFTKR